MKDTLFLEKNYKEEMQNYKNIASGLQKFEWDWLIITASNENQKAAYIEQINYRKKINFLPKSLRVDIIEDPEGKRVGSGGATFNVLKFLYEQDSDFLNKKILLIHSGGDSKRVPSCSASGKLFSNVPRKLYNNRCSTLFDEFIISFSDVPSRIKNGILVLSGDVLLLFNSLQVDVHEYDIASISVKVPVEIGQNHGVILSDKNNIVKKFLHKLNIKELKSVGAVDDNGLVNLDTGCIWMSSNVLKSLLDLFIKNDKINLKEYNKYVNDVNRLSFYGDLLYPFSSSGNITDYLNMPAEGIIDDNLLYVRNKIWKKLHNYSFGIIKTSPSRFIHTGTTKEMIDLFVEADEKYSFLGWSCNVLNNKTITGSSIINSLINSDRIGNNSLIENSKIIDGSIIEDNCLISNTIFNGHLYKNTVIHTLPINYNNSIKYVTRIYSVFDNPKNSDNYLNTSIKDFLNNNKISDLNNMDLWNMPLFPVCDSIEDSIDFALIIQNMAKNKASKEEIKLWKDKEKLSLKESFNLSNTDEILKFQESIECEVLTQSILNDFLENENSYESVLDYIDNNNVIQIVDNLKKYDNNYKISLLLSRIMYKYNNLFDPVLSQYYEDKCYEIISKKIISNNRVKIKHEKKMIHNSITNRFPVRINFGGGWSDTAPHCLEHGGTVLNAAINLNGKLPIKVTVKKNKEKKFIFISKDCNVCKEYFSTAEFGDLKQVGDAFILTKASLKLLDIDDSVLKDSGITIITDVDVPKGSGLGTSSILAASIIKTLSDFFLLGLSVEDISTLVFCVEQMISTGGGWQDQIGGITKGLKLIETSKGLKQTFKITELDNNSPVIKELNDKIVLIFAGQRRIAKRLLRKIMNKFILNEPETLDILKKIQYISLLMKFELEKGTLKGFNDLLNYHFELIKKLDKDVSNIGIDHLISTIAEYIDSYFLVGAGGGGFIVAILKDEKYKKNVKDTLNLIYKDIGIEVFECEIV